MFVYQISRLVQRCQSSSATSLDEEDLAKFPGHRNAARYVYEPTFVLPDETEAVPVYRVMDKHGDILRAEQDPQVV